MGEPEITRRIIQIMLDSRELAEREDDPHVAFHVRSHLPLPSTLCTTCNKDKAMAPPVFVRTCPACQSPTRADQGHLGPEAICTNTACSKIWLDAPPA